MPTEFIQTLPSTSDELGITIACCEELLLMSFGSGSIVNFSVLGSNLASPACSIRATQRLPALSNSMSRLPGGSSALSTGIGYSVALPVLGSSLPMN